MSKEKKHKLKKSDNKSPRSHLKIGTQTRDAREVIPKVISVTLSISRKPKIGSNGVQSPRQSRTSDCETHFVSCLRAIIKTCFLSTVDKGYKWTIWRYNHVLYLFLDILVVLLPRSSSTWRDQYDWQVVENQLFKSQITGLESFTADYTKNTPVCLSHCVCLLVPLRAATNTILIFLLWYYVFCVYSMSLGVSPSPTESWIWDL